MKFRASVEDISRWTQNKVFATAALSVILVCMFGIALVLSQTFHRRIDAVSRKWFKLGEQQMSTGDARGAVESYRTALVYSHDNPKFRLRLGEALATAGQTNEAIAYLTTLWEREPGDGRLNLELARLSKQSGDFRSAQQYFHGAIYGLWDSRADEMRLKARTELIEYLISQKHPQQAESELVALVPELPDDPELHKATASKFVQLGDCNRALALYTDVLRRNRTDVEALQGAATCSYDLGYYRSVATYVRRIPVSQRSAETNRLLATSEAVLQLDPQVASSPLDQARRVERAFKTVGQRLQTCSETDVSSAGAAPQTQQLAQWTQMKPTVTIDALRRSDEFSDSVLRFVYQSERMASDRCGQGSPEDSALLLLAKQQEASQ